MGEELGELFCDLDREFTGRAENDCLGHAFRRINFLDDGDAECGGLPGTCLCLGSHIMPGLDEGDGECLDRRGFFKTHIFYCFSDLLRKVEIGELDSCIHVAPLFSV